MGNDNVTIEPKIIYDNDGCSTKFIIVDPNPTYANVRQEDLNIYAKLVAKAKSKSIITTTEEVTTVETLNLRTIDLLTPQETVKFQSKDGSGEIDKNVDRDFLGTDWTEIGRGILKDPKIGSDFEGFGITNIDIKIEASLTPRVNIDFVDIRGATLFEQGSCSPYGLFFHLPYPIFELTVKGFYGKPVKWYLNLIKFNTKFNSETGNFESKAEFIGYSYAFLADMLMGYVMAGPYMTDYNAHDKLFGIYKNIGNYYSDSELGTDTFCPENASKKTECITIVSLLERLQNLGGALGEVKALDEYEKLQNLINIRNKLRDLIELTQNYIKEIGPKGNGFTKTKSEAGKKQMTKFISVEKFPTGINDSITSKNTEYWGKKTGAIGLIPIKVEFIWGMPYDGENKAGSIVKIFSSDENSPLSELKFQNNFIEDNPYQKSGSDNFIDLGIFIEGVISDIKKVNAEIKNLRKTVNAAVDVVVTEALGFRPTIRNVFIVLTANVELFIALLKEATALAEIYHNDQKYTELNPSEEGTLSSGVLKAEKGTVWPWPTYYTKEDKFDGLGDNDEVKLSPATVEKYPGENPDFSLWEEVRFVDNFLWALLNMNKDVEELSDKRQGIAGRDNYVPINPLESPINDSRVELKYKEAEDDSNKMIYKTIGERMFVSLDHSYYQPIHLRENGVMSSSGPIRKGKDWNPLFGSRKKDLASVLGELDAQNLLNTLENVTTIQELNQTMNTNTGLIETIKTSLGIELVKTNEIRKDDFLYGVSGTPKTLTSTQTGNNTSGTFLDIPWTNVNPLDTSFLGIAADDKEGQIIESEFNLNDVIKWGASKSWKYKPIDRNGDPTEGIILNGNRTTPIVIKPNPFDMELKDLFKIIDATTANSAPKIGIYGDDNRVTQINDNITQFNKVFMESVGRVVVGDGFEGDNLVNFKIDDNTKCLTFDSDIMFIRLRPDLTTSGGLSVLSNKHFLTPNYWGNNEDNNNFVTIPQYHPNKAIYQTKMGTSSFFSMAATFELGPIKEKISNNNFTSDSIFNSYTIKQTTSSTTDVEAKTAFKNGAAPPLAYNYSTPIVYNTLVQTPLWLDNCNNFRAGINSSPLGYVGYGGDKKDSIDLFGQHINQGDDKLISLVCNASKLGSSSTSKCTSKEVQDRNLGYLFLHSFKPAPFTINSMSLLGEAKSCDKPFGCCNTNAIHEDDEDNKVWKSTPEPYARIPFANAASMIKVPKLWVYAVGATFWRYRSWRGSTIVPPTSSGRDNKVRWNKGTDTYKTGFDPLAQPGYPTRGNFYQTNSSAGTVTINGIASSTAVQNIQCEPSLAPIYSCLTKGPSYLGYDANLYGGDNSVGAVNNLFSDLFNYADSNIRTKAYYKYVLGYPTTFGGTDYDGINNPTGPNMNQYVQASSFMDTIHQGLRNGQQTYSAGYGAYFDYYGLYSKTTQDNNQFKELFVSHTSGDVFSKKAENIYALYKPEIESSLTEWYMGWFNNTTDINGITTETDFRFSSVGSDIYGTNSSVINNSGRVMRDTWWDIKYIAPWDFGYFTPTGFDDDKWFKTINILDDNEYNGLYATLPQVGSIMTYQSMSPAQPHYYYMAINGDTQGGQDYNDIKAIDSPYHNGNEGRIIYESLPDDIKNMFIDEFEKWVDTDFAPNILPTIDPCNFGDEGSDSFINAYELIKLEQIKVSGEGGFQTNGNGNPSLADDYILSLDSNLTSIDKALKEHFIILNSTPKIWWGHNEKEFFDYFLVDDTLATKYLDGFKDAFKAQSKGRIDELQKDNKSEDILGESATDDNDIKLSIYRSMKSISDKWLSSSGSGKLFFNITDDECSRVKDENVQGGAEKPLAAHFTFVNRLMGDIGDEAVIDITKLNKLQDNKRESFYQLIVDLLAENKFDFFPLPSFFNFTQSKQLFRDKPQDEEQQKQLRKDLVQMFQPATIWDCVSGGPQFISMFVGGTSRTLDLPPQANCPIDKNDLDTLKNDSFDLGRIGEECPKESGGVSAFRVAYGIENQSHFKSIQLDQAEFSETNESLQVIDKLANAGDPSNRALKGQNLHNVYLTRSYNCTVEAMGNMMISPLMYFELTNVPMFHGTYIIKEVSHKVSPHSVATTFMGTRQPIATVPIIKEIASALSVAISSADVVEDGRTVEEILGGVKSSGGSSQGGDEDSDSGGSSGRGGSTDCTTPWVANYYYGAGGQTGVKGHKMFNSVDGGWLPQVKGSCQALVKDTRSGYPRWVHWEYSDALKALDDKFKDTFGFDMPLGTVGGYRSTIKQVYMRIKNDCPTCGSRGLNRDGGSNFTESSCYKNGYLVHKNSNGQDIGILNKAQLESCSGGAPKCCKSDTPTARVYWKDSAKRFVNGSNHGYGASIDSGIPKKLKGGYKSYNFWGSTSKKGWKASSQYSGPALSGARKEVKSLGLLKSDGTIDITAVKKLWIKDGSGVIGNAKHAAIYYVWLRKTMPQFGMEVIASEAWHIDYILGPPHTNTKVYGWYEPANQDGTGIKGNYTDAPTAKTWKPSGNYKHEQQLYLNVTTGRPCTNPNQKCNDFPSLSTSLSADDLFSHTAAGTEFDKVESGGHIYTVPKKPKNGFEELLIIWPGIVPKNDAGYNCNGCPLGCCNGKWMYEELNIRNIPTLENYHILFMATSNSDLNSAITTIDADVTLGKKPSEFDKSKTSLAGFSGGGGGCLSNYDENYKLVVLMDASLTKDPTTLGNLKNMVNGYINNGVMYKTHNNGCGSNGSDGSCYEKFDTEIKNKGGAVEKISVTSINNTNAGLPNRPASGFHGNVPTYMINRWFS